MSCSNSISMVDLFCGAGIGAVGFKRAGYNIVWAIDNNSHAVDTYNRNIGNHAELQDIKDLDLSTIPESDVISGGFPCTPFSVAGKGLGSSDSRKGDLPYYFLQAVRVKKPKAFLLENVAGIVNKDHREFFNNLISEFESLGYDVNWKLINCVDYGVPQKRKRVFAVGVRKDLGRGFTFPAFVPEEERLTIRDAIGELPEPVSYGEESIPKNHYGLGIRNDEKPFIHKVPAGGNWRDLPVEDQKSFMGNSFYRKGGRTGYLKKISFDCPSNTITSQMDGKFNAQIVDNRDKYNDLSVEQKNRRFTVRECLRLQTVPDSFSFSDDVPLRKQYERCSGIPSKVAYILSNQLAMVLKGSTITAEKKGQLELF